jgi:WhiB family transcriptional regulator, redox-sensing transcriptional regulator
MGAVLRADDWDMLAACRGQTDVMFPERGESSAPAKALCAVCDVFLECRSYALSPEANAGSPLEGVWGGMSKGERMAAMRARRAA